MTGGIGVRLPDKPHASSFAPCRVGVVAADDLDRRRVVRALEEGGLVVEDAGDTAPVDVIVSVPGASTTTGHDRPLVLVLAEVDRVSVDRALASGAAGIVAESDVDERLAATVRAVWCGQLCIPAEQAHSVKRTVLSAREKQVMSMVVLGFTNQEIANKLHVTETTVKSHLSSAYRKLRVRSRQEATALILADQAIGLGILTLAGDRTAHRSGRG